MAVGGWRLVVGGWRLAVRKANHTGRRKRATAGVFAATLVSRASKHEQVAHYAISGDIVRYRATLCDVGGYSTKAVNG